MKSLLAIAAFALSLILVVSAQCNHDEVTGCYEDFGRRVSKLDLQLCVHASSHSCNSMYDVCITSSINFCHLLQGKFFTNHNCHGTTRYCL